jgi:hypothetical protein
VQGTKIQGSQKCDRFFFSRDEYYTHSLPLVSHTRSGLGDIVRLSFQITVYISSVKSPPPPPKVLTEIADRGRERCSGSEIENKEVGTWWEQIEGDRDTSSTTNLSNYRNLRMICGSSIWARSFPLFPVNVSVFLFFLGGRVQKLTLSE